MVDDSSCLRKVEVRSLQIVANEAFIRDEGQTIRSNLNGNSFRKKINMIFIIYGYNY